MAFRQNSLTACYILCSGKISDGTLTINRRLLRRWHLLTLLTIVTVVVVAGPMLVRLPT